MMERISQRELDALNARKGELLSALQKAVEVIKQWHNMDGSGDVWQIYYDNAPEMKPIREALSSHPDWNGLDDGLPHHNRNE